MATATVANAADAFGGESERREPTIDVKALHAKIGQHVSEHSNAATTEQLKTGHAA